jgi:hypothetical protein
VVAVLVAAPGCLLFLDPINSPPQVQIVLPSTPIHMNADVTFQAKASDPDDTAEPLTFAWDASTGRCADAGRGPLATRSQNEAVTVRPPSFDPFCVRVTVRDHQGAAASHQVEARASNRRPVAKLEVVDPKPTPPVIPLYTRVAVSGEGSQDEDGAKPALTYKIVQDSAEVPHEPCEIGAMRAICFQAKKSGAYAATVVASDGELEASATLTLSVAEDQPPCIVDTDPRVTVPTVVLASDGPPRIFEVKAVRDDGHPFPAGPLGRTKFQWFLGRGERGPLARHIEHDRPELEVGPRLFDDVRPGDSVRVRVEVHDPLSETGPRLAALASRCGEQPLCAEPAECVRWVTWKVDFR